MFLPDTCEALLLADFSFLLKCVIQILFFKVATILISSKFSVPFSLHYFFLIGNFSLSQILYDSLIYSIPLLHLTFIKGFFAAAASHFLHLLAQRQTYIFRFN